MAKEFSQKLSDILTEDIDLSFESDDLPNAITVYNESNANHREKLQYIISGSYQMNVVNMINNL